MLATKLIEKKSKNMVRPDFLAKFKLLKELSPKLGYPTLKAKLVIAKLRQILIKVPISYFDLEYHFWIQTDISGYTIGRVLSQLTLDDLDHWHLVAFFSQKMISAKT